jgi:hypothetical protein
MHAVLHRIISPDIFYLDDTNTTIPRDTLLLLPSDLESLGLSLRSTILLRRKLPKRVFLPISKKGIAATSFRSIDDDSAFTCCICYEADRNALMTFVQPHTCICFHRQKNFICVDCITQVVRTAKKAGLDQKCPICRTDFLQHPAA